MTKSREQGENEVTRAAKREAARTAPIFALCSHEC